MKHLVTSSVFDLNDYMPNDYVYHFYVETFRSNFVEVSFNDYMKTLKLCRDYKSRHHVDVRQYCFRCYNIFLEQ